MHINPCAIAAVIYAITVHSRAAGQSMMCRRCASACQLYKWQWQDNLKKSFTSTLLSDTTDICKSDHHMLIACFSLRVHMHVSRTTRESKHDVASAPRCQRKRVLCSSDIMLAAMFTLNPCLICVFAFSLDSLICWFQASRCRRSPTLLRPRLPSGEPPESE